MKTKKLSTSIILIILSFFSFFIGFVSGHTSTHMANNIFDKLKLINIEFSSVVNYSSVRGIHDDGISFWMFSNVNENIGDQLSSWSCYTDNDLASCILFGGVVDDTYYQAFIPNEIKMTLNKVADGVYTCLTNNGEYVHELNSIYNGTCMNFLFAIFDFETNTLYVLENNS